MPVDRQGVEDATRALLVALGEDPDREGLRETPQRVARAWVEFLQVDDVVTTSFSETCDEMVVVRDIAFHSFCEHHLLPFTGRAHIAYIPNGEVVGISKLARILDQYARALQIQERLTAQVADAIQEATGALGVAVIIEAEHTCMTLRGVRKPGAVTVTSALRGVFHDNAAARSEVLALCQRG
jgi:GTP cyclohydrolase I